MSECDSGGCYRHSSRSIEWLMAGGVQTGMNVATESDNGQVLVVARSRINLVVVSEIVHRCGLRAIAESIEGAAGKLKAGRPRLVILDGGAENRDCDTLLQHIAALQRTSETRTPRVIMLSNRNGSVESLALSSLVDEVVAKPITPERLQPVIDRLARHKG